MQAPIVGQDLAPGFHQPAKMKEIPLTNNPHLNKILSQDAVVVSPHVKQEPLLEKFQPILAKKKF